jgi:hypothetical protein
MVRHQTLRFLFVCGLTTILLVGGLGVEDREYSFREDQIFFRVNSFFGKGHETESLPIKIKKNRQTAATYST